MLYRCSPLLVIAFIFALGCGGGQMSTSTPPPPPVPLPQLQLATFVSGLSSPVGLESAHDGSGRLFVLEQAGTIRIIRNGAVVATPFLDITGKVASGGELGLLGLTFHPAFSSNHKFYVDYTRPMGAQWETVVAEYLTSTNPDQADPATERILLTVAQPFSNHNGGQLAFGPDGFLYIALGDGGSGGDPMGNGQNRQVLLGKILRIDVNSAAGGKPYAIPPDNPFAAAGGAPEIFAYGLRNPWRFSFDTSNGTLFAGDVGESSFEEVDIIQKGVNYGWNVMEGTHCFQPATGCNLTGLTLPINDYGRDQGATVIGGFVYRGSSIPALAGAYVFGDFISGRIWGLRLNSSGAWERTQLADTGKNISSFGRDESNELYVVDYSGAVWRLAAK